MDFLIQTYNKPGWIGATLNFFKDYPEWVIFICGVLWLTYLHSQSKKTETGGKKLIRQKRDTQSTVRLDIFHWRFQSYAFGDESHKFAELGIFTLSVLNVAQPHEIKTAAQEVIAEIEISSGQGEWQIGPFRAGWLSGDQTVPSPWVNFDPISIDSQETKFLAFAIQYTGFRPYLIRQESLPYPLWMNPDYVLLSQFNLSIHLKGINADEQFNYSGKWTGKDIQLQRIQ